VIMVSRYVEVPGGHVAAADLRYPRSKSLSHFLFSKINPHAELVEVLRTPEGHEVVVFDVEVEVSQLRRHDIRPRERLAIIFREQELLHPEVLALREDFPYVPHLNPRDEEIPRSICLYEEDFDELRLTWTPAGFIERARWWLSETAKGTLHGEDQPLEPILLGDFPPLVLPSNFLQTVADTNSPQPLGIELRRSGSREVYVAQPSTPATAFAAIAVTSPPHVHGAIRSHPRNSKRLNEILKGVGLDLFDDLRKRLTEWQLSPVLLNAPPIIIVILPKQRKTGTEVERLELWAFLLLTTVGELGVGLGILERHGSSFGRVLGGTPDDRLLEGMTIYVLNPTFSLSRLGAATLSGTKPNPQRIAAIGVGALGSQVIESLVRTGFGIWTGIDSDVFLPHNAARHELTQHEVGRLKVEGMQIKLNALLDEIAMPSTLEANVLRPGLKETELHEALSNVETILDMSASLPVARKLAYYPDKRIRRCSVFLNPSGSDLVLLCEDKNRRARLDWLEFQYYRELVSNQALALHFEADANRIRYARSCRDLTSLVPQHLIAMHSGIASHALQQCLPRPDAVVRIWHSDSSMNVKAYAVETCPVVDLTIDRWRVCTDRVFARKLRKHRQAQLPRETGGVLIGNFDQENRVVYLADMLPSPPDSEEWPTLYVRGSQGLESAVKRVRERTDNQLQYIGEWHSHPDGYNTEPSGDDKTVFGWLAEHAARDSNPPVMAIAGEKDIRIFVGSIDNCALLKPEK